MAAKLKIENVDTNPVQIDPDGDGDSVTINTGQNAELEAALLTSRKFAQLLNEGRIRFVKTPVPTTEQYELARLVFPKLIRTLGGDFVEIHDAVLAARQQLLALHAKYNKQWTVAEQTLIVAEQAAAGAKHLAEGANHFFSTKPETNAIAALEAELLVLKDEDLNQSGKPFNVWLEEFEAKNHELHVAEQKLALVERAYFNPLADLRDRLDVVQAELAVVDHATDIGAQVPSF